MTEYISLGSNCSVTYQLNKYGFRSRANLFDWVKISLSQLTIILENDFDDFVESLEFKKTSKIHEYFGLVDKESNYDNLDNLDNLDNFDNLNNLVNLDNSQDSIVLTNKYHIEFAHEISQISQIEYFKSRLVIRIERFKNLEQLSNPNNTNKSKTICFVRIELAPIKSNWTGQINNLIRLLEKYISKFKLILIINSLYDYRNLFPEFVKIIKFDNFSPDWKMDDLDWENIFPI